MAESNPLVAAPSEKQTLNTMTNGAGLFNDAAATFTDFQSGNYAGLVTDAVGDGLDGLGMAMDPLGQLAGAGIGWLIEHVSFLKEPLDYLAGNAEEVTAKQQTWQNVGKALKDAADKYEQSAGAMASANQGTAVSGAGDTGKNLATVLRGAASHADDAAQAMGVSATIVGTTRGIIRDTISQFAGDAIVKFVASTVADICTFGGATAAFIVDEVAEGASMAASNAGKVSKVASALEKFKTTLHSSGSKIEHATEQISKDTKNIEKVGAEAKTGDRAATNTGKTKPSSTGESTTPQHADTGSGSTGNHGETKPSSTGESTTPQHADTGSASANPKEHYWDKRQAEEQPKPRAELAQQAGQHKQALAQHNQKVADYNKQAADLKTSTASHNERAVSHEQAVGNHNDRLAEHQQQKADHTQQAGENQANRDANAQARQANQNAMDRAKANGQPTHQLEQQRQHLNGERDRLNNEHTQLNHENNRLGNQQKSLDAEQHRLTREDQQLAQHQDQLTQRQSEMDKQRTDINQNATKLQEHQKELSEHIGENWKDRKSLMNDNFNTDHPLIDKLQKVHFGTEVYEHFDVGGALNEPGHQALSEQPDIHEHIAQESEARMKEWEASQQAAAPPDTGAAPTPGVGPEAAPTQPAWPTGA
jgi:hypothetical protein